VVGASPPKSVPEGVSKVLHVPIDDKLSETVASAVKAVVEGDNDDDDECVLVVGTQSKFGSTVVPRAAALLDVSPVTDVLEIEDEREFVHCTALHCNALHWIALNCIHGCDCDCGLVQFWFG